MKKLILLSAFFALTSNSYAANIFGDGSPSNTHIAGKEVVKSNNLAEENLPSYFYIGDGSRSNNYIQGSAPKIAFETQSIPVDHRDVWGR